MTFVFDIDGTIKSSVESKYKPIELIKKILLKSKNVVLITDSGASAFLGIIQEINKLLNENNIEKSVFIGIGNGVGLYEITKNEIKKLYQYCLEKNDILKILEVYNSVIAENRIEKNFFIKKGVTIFNEFLLKDWTNTIPSDYILSSKTYGGKCFIEPLKITFVMPEDSIVSQRLFIQEIQECLNVAFKKQYCIIEKGDDIFAHTTIYPNMSPKLFALLKIKERLKTTDAEIACFGDTPDGNDRGLLIDSKLY